jgi:phosphoribosylamine---glycine ligase
MRVLVIGSGGREHALARALARDGDVTALHVAPGNPGIARVAEIHPVTPADPASVTALAASTGADLVVIGPEAPLVAGVADALRAAGTSCFGPGRAAAMIEGSKSFAKQVMSAAGIPTAAARTCATGAEVGLALDEFGPPYVVKADGLAAGKGVVVTGDRRTAEAHARAVLSRGDTVPPGTVSSRGTPPGPHGPDPGGPEPSDVLAGPPDPSAAGPVVVIEEFLDGPEVSVFALADGVTAVPLLPAQDFKRAFDDDAGPNTGGMGAYAPLPWAPPGLAEEVLGTVIRPAVAELRRRGTPYAGLLYAGLALTAAGIRVVEFNARFGDPETQVVLDRLATPLGGLLHAAAAGGLAGTGPPRWRPGAAVTVVLAAEGYPGAPVTGDRIEDLQDSERTPGAYVLQAGTAMSAAGDLVSAGGRVLNVVGTGADLAAARAVAYEAAGKISMRGGWYRRDIAERAATAAPPGP